MEWFFDSWLNIIIGLWGLFWLILYLGRLFEIVGEEIKKKGHRRQVLDRAQSLLKNKPQKQNPTEFFYWLTYIEPKYSNLDNYPPDWGKRKKYIAEIYSYTCALCNKNEELGHTHHIIPLSEGGDNAIKNLTYLCRNCHEDQHWHLIKRRERRMYEIKSRGITEEDYFKEKKQQYETHQVFEKVFGYPTRSLKKKQSSPPPSVSEGAGVNAETSFSP